jgi:hypothetical protein
MQDEEQRAGLSFFVPARWLCNHPPSSVAVRSLRIQAVLVTINAPCSELK